MQQLNSKNYDEVIVTIRNQSGSDMVPMAPHSGLALMDYLTSGEAAKHVQITSRDGHVVVVRTTDISLVEPHKKVDLKEYV
jgi:hypothetical protein